MYISESVPFINHGYTK